LLKGELKNCPGAEKGKGGRKSKGILRKKAGGGGKKGEKQGDLG